jgi:hypothetical protein
VHIALRFILAQRHTAENAAEQGVMPCHKQYRHVFHPVTYNQERVNMIIIWRGFGWIVPVIFVAGFVILSNTIPDTLNEWKLAIVIAIPSLIIAIIGYILNHKKRGVFVNQETGKEEKSPSHSLFFVPIELWAIIVPIVFIWAAFS